MTSARRLGAVLEPTKDAVLRMKERLDGASITNQNAWYVPGSVKVGYRDQLHPLLLQAAAAALAGGDQG